MKHYKSLILLFFVTVLTLAGLLSSQSASAVTSSSLSIEPTKTYIIKPGQTIKDKLSISNLDNFNMLDLNLSLVDFTYSGTGGTPKLMLEQDASPTTWSLKPFAKIPGHVKVKPTSSNTIPFSISVPKGHGAGSYYSAIMYASGTPGSGNVGLSASGVTLVFVTIPGKVHEDLHLEKLGAYHGDPSTPNSGYAYINLKKPELIGYTLENKGNVTEAPVGSITLNDWFGHETKINNINPRGSLALIGQTRTFTTCIKLKEETEQTKSNNRNNTCVEPTMWPGHYTVTLDAYYGQNGNPTQEIVRTAGFWYLPVWFLVLVAIVLLFIVYVIWRIRRYVRGKGLSFSAASGTRRRR